MSVDNLKTLPNSMVLGDEVMQYILSNSPVLLLSCNANVLVSIVETALRVEDSIGMLLGLSHPEHCGNRYDHCDDLGNVQHFPIRNGPPHYKVYCIGDSSPKY